MTLFGTPNPQDPCIGEAVPSRAAGAFCLKARILDSGSWPVASRTLRRYSNVRGLISPVAGSTFSELTRRWWPPSRSIADRFGMNLVGRGGGGGTFGLHPALQTRAIRRLCDMGDSDYLLCIHYGIPSNKRLPKAKFISTPNRFFGTKEKEINKSENKIIIRGMCSPCISLPEI